MNRSELKELRKAYDKGRRWGLGLGVRHVPTCLYGADSPCGKEFLKGYDDVNREYQELEAPK